MISPRAPTRRFGPLPLTIKSEKDGPESSWSRSEVGRRGWAVELAVDVSDTAVAKQRDRRGLCRVEVWVRVLKPEAQE